METLLIFKLYLQSYNIIIRGYLLLYITQNNEICLQMVAENKSIYFIIAKHSVNIPLDGLFGLLGLFADSIIIGSWTCCHFCASKVNGHCTLRPQCKGKIRYVFNKYMCIYCPSTSIRTRECIKIHSYVYKHYMPADHGSVIPKKMYHESITHAMY